MDAPVCRTVLDPRLEAAFADAKSRQALWNVSVDAVIDPDFNSVAMFDDGCDCALCCGISDYFGLRPNFEEQGRIERAEHEEEVAAEETERLERRKAQSARRNARRERRRS